MGLYKDWIAEMKRKWISKKVIYEGKQYNVVGVDYNGLLLIDKKGNHTDDTAVESYDVTELV